MPPTTTPARGKTRSRRARLVWISSAAAAVAVVLFGAFAHPFLAITRRVAADILIVEGWVPDHVIVAAAQEFQAGGYSRIFISGLQPEEPTKAGEAASSAERGVRILTDAGVSASAIVAAPAPPARWSRTSKMARAVRDRIRELGLQPKGVNVVTAGPHARETWVAFGHAFEPATPVGIISVPKRNYDPDRWWLSWQGLKWVPKDFLGWLKEVLLGQRS